MKTLVIFQFLCRNIIIFRPFLPKKEKKRKEKRDFFVSSEKSCIFAGGKEYKKRKHEIREYF